MTRAVNTLEDKTMNDPRGHRVGFKESMLPHKQATRRLHPEAFVAGEDRNPHTRRRLMGTFTPSDATHPDGNRSTRRAALRQRVLQLRAEGKLTQERNPAPLGGS